MSCKHRKLQTWHFEDDGIPAGMWSCVDCGHKFVPVNIAQEKDAKLYRWLRANLVGLIHLLGDQAIGVSGLTGDEFDASIRAAMRAEQFPGVDIDAAHRKA